MITELYNVFAWFYKSAKLFSKVLYHCIIWSPVKDSSCCLLCYPQFLFFHFGHSNWWVVFSHISWFYFIFSIDKRVWISFHVFIYHLCIFLPSECLPYEVAINFITINSFLQLRNLWIKAIIVLRSCSW